MTQELVAVESPSAKTPSVMRYDRVQAILEGDPALKELLGPKDQEVKKRNGEKHFYSRGTVLVTNTLHERQFDAHNVDKNIVLALALELLPEKAAKISPAKPPKKPEPQPKKVEKPKAAKPEPKPRPTPPKKVEPKPKVTPSAKQEPVAVTSAAPAPAVAAPAPAEAATAVDSKPAFVYYIYGNALSLAVALAKMLEVGDRLPGAEQRQQAANNIIDLLIPLRDQPVPMPKDLMPATIQNVKASVSSKG